MLSTHPDRIERIAANLEITVNEVRQQINAELHELPLDGYTIANCNSVIDSFEQLGLRYQEHLDLRDYNV